MGLGERVKSRLSQALTRDTRPDSNSRPAVQILNPLPSRYALREQLQHIANATTRMKVMKKKKQHKNKRNNGIAITSSFPFFYFALLFQKINKDWETKK